MARPHVSLAKCSSQGGLPLSFRGHVVIDRQDIRLFETEAQQMTSSMVYTGILRASSREISFESNEAFDLASQAFVAVSKLCEIEITDIMVVLKRRHLHNDNSCEIFTRRNSFFFILPPKVRDHFLSFLGLFDFYVQTGTSATCLKDLEIVSKWRQGQMSNYDYLLWLNFIAGRSFHDISQYPIYPWVLAEYSRDELDLRNPTNFRSLSIPLGLLSDDRYRLIKQFFVDTKSHYGSYYSNSAYVSTFQDHSFGSVPETWENVSGRFPDFRELIPEFFSTASLFATAELPKWAKSPAEFIYRHRSALESRMISLQLHCWIDLIFGSKSRGRSAITSINDFHRFSYPELVEQDLNKEITDFAWTHGIVPEVLFPESAAPARDINDSPSLFHLPFLEFVTDFKNAINVKALTSSEVLVVTSDLHVVKVDIFTNTVIDLCYKDRYRGYFAEGGIVQFIPHENIIVLASSIRKNCHVLDVCESSLKYLCSGFTGPMLVRQIAADSRRLFVAREVMINILCLLHSKLFVIWSLCRRRDNSLGEIRKVLSTVHKCEIVEVAGSASFNTAAAITTEPSLVLSCIINGAFEREALLDAPASHVRMTNGGHILVFYDGDFEGGMKTRIDLFDLNCCRLFSKTFLPRLVRFDVAAMDCVDDIVVLCCTDGTLYIVKAFGLTEVAQCRLPDIPIALSVGHGMTVFLAMRNGALGYARLGTRSS
jgi:hypothetical protein